MTTSMRAIEISKPGDADALTLTRRTQPTPGAEEVVINVAAAGVNRPDILQRMGLYPPPEGASDIPGLEVAGHVVAMGTGVTGFNVGDKVVALLTGGGYADYAAADFRCVLPLPRGLSMVEGASLPETFFTVWSNVMDRGHLQKGERFLVHGGTSGIGVSAIQMARAMGAEVFTTAGSAEKVQACLDLGAAYAINYKENDFVDEIQRITDNEGVDVILDMVAGPYIQKDLELLAKDGRLVFIAFLGGPSAEVNFVPILRKRLTVTGSTLRPQDSAFKGAIAQKLKQRIWPLIESGVIRPVIDSVYPLEQAAMAHKRMEDGGHIGKIILDCDS